MAKKTVDPIVKLENELNKLQQKLAKAHQASVAKLEKNFQTEANKLTKAREKLATLREKTTPAAARQKDVIREKIASISLDCTVIRSRLKDAKKQFGRFNDLTKAETQAVKSLAKQIKKKPKKSIKKQVGQKSTAPTQKKIKESSIVVTKSSATSKKTDKVGAKKSGIKNKPRIAKSIAPSAHGNNNDSEAGAQSKITSSAGSTFSIKSSLATNDSIAPAARSTVSQPKTSAERFPQSTAQPSPDSIKNASYVAERESTPEENSFGESTSNVSSLFGMIKKSDDANKDKVTTDSITRHDVGKPDSDEQDNKPS